MMGDGNGLIWGMEMKIGVKEGGRTRTLRFPPLPFAFSDLFFEQIPHLSALLTAASALLAAASNGQHRGIFPLCHSPAAGGVPLAAGEWTSKGKTPFLSFPWPVLAPLAPVLGFLMFHSCLKVSKTFEIGLFTSSNST